MKWLILVFLSILPHTSIYAELLELAGQSERQGQLNRTKSAELLQVAISDGQSLAYMRQHLGVDPRIVAQVYADKIRVAFRSFNQFSQPPVVWSRAGASLRDFDAHWDDVVRAEITSEPEAPDVLFIELTDRQDLQTKIPLDTNTCPSSRADLALALAVLMEKLPAAPDTLPTPEPPAETVSEPPEAVVESTPVLPLVSTNETSDGVEAELPIPSLPESAQTNPLERDQILRKKLQLLRDLYNEGLLEREVYLEKQREILDDFTRTEPSGHELPDSALPSREGENREPGETF